MHRFARSALAVLVGVGAVSCGDPVTTSPAAHVKPRAASFDVIPLAGSKVVISQVYGGGGNSGATLKNDFIELYNGSASPVDLTGASVQYASATGTSWQVTNLSGTIASGAYYLIQESAGAGGTVSLPTPDATGSGTGIAMSATAGKVALVSNTTAISGTGCSATTPPTFPATIIDYVGYGNTTGSTANCAEGGAPVATLSNTTAALRKTNGQQDTNNNGADFSTGAPNPRNSASPLLPPADALIVMISPAAPTASIGDNVNFTASATMAGQAVAITSATWSTSDAGVATIDPTSGAAHAVGAGHSTIGVDVVTASGNGSTTTTLTVNSGTITPSTTFVSEIHYDNTGTDANEAIEIEGDAGSSLNGWSLVLYDGNGGVPYNTTALSGTMPATCSTRGVVVINFPVNGIQNGSPDGWALVDAQGHVTEFKSYEGTFAATSGPATGLTSTAIDADESTPGSPTQSVQRAGNGVWFGPVANTFGACNAAAPPPPPPPPGTISVQPRTAPLPVGFQTQLFLNNGGVDGQGHPVGNADVTWSTSDAAIVAVNATNGVVTAKAVGSATLTATAKSDAVTTASTTITTYDAPIGANARVGHNTELGTPIDGDPSDDIIISRREYTLSYNPNHGNPNWVSWNLDDSHKGSSARCNCFTPDPELTNLSLPAYDTNDWINGGVWSRGHMSPSADWTDADGDNAPTFYLSNMLPQNQTLNAGAWGDLENYLRTLTTGASEIYIIAGGIFTKNRSGAGLDGFGFMNSLGHIAVPDSVWKIAIVVPDGRTADQITSPSDVQVIAAKFPNDASGTGTWNRYATTINEIQKSTAYNFLSAIPEAVQCKIEVRNCVPQAHIVAAGSNTVAAGTQFILNTSAVDGDGADGPWRIVIDWGDGTSFSATALVLPTDIKPLVRGKTWTTPGVYTVRVTITDRKGGSSSTTLQVIVTP